MKSLFNAKKMLAILILMLAAADTILPVSAMEVTQGDVLNKVDGRYGASLDSVTGARVDTDLTNATITNTQTNSVLNWNNLNTAPNQTLNYVMKVGQTSLNNVTGVGLSEFAGTINAEKGRLIISNPNGIIFENGSYINANALTVTTHYATLDNNGDLRLYSPDNNASIKIMGGNNGVTFRIAKDLNIVSNNIDVNKADIIAEDIRLITSDGVTFYAVNHNNKAYQPKSIATDGDANYGDVKIEKSSFAVKNNETGKIAVYSKGTVTVDKKSQFNGTANIEAKGKVAIYDSKVNNLDVKSHSTKTDADGAIVVYGVEGNKLTLNAMNGKARVRNNSKFKSIRAAAAEVQFNNVELNNGDINATKRINASDIKIKNSTLVSGDTVEISGSEVKDTIVEATNINALASNISDSNLTATGTIYATDKNDVGAEIKNSTLSAGNEMRLANAKLDNSILETKSAKLNGASLLNNTSLTANKIADDSNDVTIKNSTLKVANGNVNLKYSTLENANVTASNGNIYIETQNVVSGNYNASGNFSAKSSDWRKNLSFDNANIVAGGNVKLMSKPNFSNSTITTTGAKSVVDMQEANISNADINAFNIYGQGSTITDSILNVTNDIIVSNSDISNSVLTATKDLKLENTNLNNVKANGRYAFLNNATLENGSILVASRLSSQGTNDYETGHIVYKKGMTVENLTIKDSTMKVGDDVYLKNAKLDNAKIETSAGKDLNIDTTENVKLVGVKIGGNLNITKAGNVEISNSKTEAGNQDIPSMTTKSPVTDYNRNKFNENYFETISGNYGNVYGKDSNLSNIVGSVNISNADNSLIINTIIGGDLEVSNIVGEANLVTSLVEGNYSIADRTNMGDVNVYKSYINGDYTSAFDYQLSNTDSANTVASALVGDINRKDYGNDVNTTFQRRFSPRGFAAQEDEITNMKNVTKSSVVKSENNKIKITKAFHAY